MNKKCLFLSFASLITLVVTSCGNKIKIPNNEKPLIWFNREPLIKDDRSLDLSMLSFNKYTYYVGIDDAGGGAAQGKTITKYLSSKTMSYLDRNKDGTLGYVLAIGDPNQDSSLERTKGTRLALATWNNSYAPNEVKVGKVKTKDGSYPCVELDAINMITSEGATWSRAVAKQKMAQWTEALGDKIDFVVCNSDELALGCLESDNFVRGIPLFGYDGIKEALYNIRDAKMHGTVYQNVDLESYTILRVIRNCLDGLKGSNIYNIGIKNADELGNSFEDEMIYVTSTRSLISQPISIDFDNYNKYTFSQRNTNLKTLNAETKKVLLTIYSSKNSYMNDYFLPALQYYAPFCKLDLSVIIGNGFDESSVLNQIKDIDSYDAFAFNLVGTSNGYQYTSLLNN